MSTSPKTSQGITLEEFLRLPDIDEPPYQEYIDGRIEAKPLPKTNHTILTKRMAARLDRFAEPGDLGETFAELRCTFAGRSIVPDLVFLLESHVPFDQGHGYDDDFLRPPDIQFEIVSPRQTVKKTHQKLLHSTTHGCPLGILIHPSRRTIEVYRPGHPPERLSDDATIDFAPVLPGLEITVTEIFSWLDNRRPTPPDRGADR